MKKIHFEIIPRLSTKQDKKNAKLMEELIDWQYEQLTKKDNLKSRFYQLIFMSYLGADVQKDMEILMKDAGIL